MKTINYKTSYGNNQNKMRKHSIVKRVYGNNQIKKRENNLSKPHT
jgi:hypothetical protein